LTQHVQAWNGSWADYDNDGYLDLFVGVGDGGLFHNNGDGTFTSLTNTTGERTLLRGGGVWGDYDNDGFIDMVGPLNTNVTLMHNNGDGTFTEILTGSIVNDGWINPVSCAWGDYDNDGFLDLVVVRGSDAAEETNLLYRNNGNSNAWVKIRLIGVASNRSAVGAKIRVKTTIRGRSMSQMREISTGIGFCGNPLEAHFGLGDATNIDLVRIEWPSGIVQKLTNVVPRQTLTVVEHQPNPGGSLAFAGVGLSTNATINLTLSGSPGAIYVLEASTNLVNWTKVGVRSNATGSVVFVDLKATSFTHRYYRASAP
jgi:enediyne biosynthesis protein E4